MRKAQEEYTGALYQINSYKYEGADEIISLLEKNVNEEQ
jgi:hypothetical protein